MPKDPPDLPFEDVEFVGMVKCHHCGVMSFPSEAIVGCVRTTGATIEEHFCSLTCRDIWLDGFVGDL